MTEVAYYDLHILLYHYNSIAKNLTQGATEVTISRVKIFYSVGGRSAGIWVSEWGEYEHPGQSTRHELNSDSILWLLWR